MKQLLLVWVMIAKVALLAHGCGGREEKPAARTPNRPPRVAEEAPLPEISDERKAHVGQPVQEPEAPGEDPATVAEEPETGHTEPATHKDEPVNDGPTVTDTELQSLVHAGKLGFDMVPLLAKTPGNLVFSPASISVALAMALGGAKGQTATEMARVLGVDPAKTERAHRLFGAALKTWNATDRVTLKVANRVFVETTVNPQPGFIALTRDVYGAPITPMDFIKNSEGSRVRINEWIAKNTENRIPSLLPQGSLNSLTRLVLANAVYFKGSWRTRFSPDLTRPKDFHSTASEVKKVPTMHMTSRLAWARHPDGLYILETPYANEHLSMIWLLPVKKHELAALESQLSMENLEKWRNATRRVEVRVQIPRFKLEPPPVKLVPVLQSLGIRKAFQGSADFSNMAELPEGLSISDVVHQAFIEVNEEGSEAAAATAVMVADGSTERPKPQPPTFIADHPFVFVLMDLRTRMPLFMGRVTHP